MKSHCFNTQKLYQTLKDSCQKESQYWLDRKSYPNTDDLVKSNERDEMVIFLLETCDRSDIAFSIDTFSLAVSLLDRFLASFKVKSKYLECLALSCLYVASKVKEENDKILSAAKLLEILPQCKLSVSELLRMELMILNKFDWNINDVTATDFVYLFHALLVDKYNQLKPLAVVKETKSKWNQMHEFKQLSDDLAKVKLSAHAPRDLDFLHVMEKKIKHCLCVNELTTNFKPHVLAYTLVLLEIEKEFRHIEDDSIKNSMTYMFRVTLLKQLKLDSDIIESCKQQINACLTSMEYLSIFFDRYYLIMLKSFRITPLSTTLNSQLSVIKEEDEEEDENVSLQKTGKIESFTDVLKKRKLSENASSSSDDENDNEVLEFGYENLS